MTPKWKNSFILGLIIVAMELVVLGLGTLNLIEVQWSVGGISIITFMGYLLLANYMAGSDSTENKLEVRNAIAATIINVHITLIGLCIFHADTIPNIENMLSIQSGLSRTVEVIILYYFGSAALKDWLTYKENVSKNSDKEKLNESKLLEENNNNTNLNKIS